MILSNKCGYCHICFRIPPDRNNHCCQCDLNDPCPDHDEKEKERRDQVWKKEKPLVKQPMID